MNNFSVQRVYHLGLQECVTMCVREFCIQDTLNGKR